MISADPKAMRERLQKMSVANQEIEDAEKASWGQSEKV